MGLAKRIIPCLDVHAGRVVKGVNFVDLRDAGDPGRGRQAVRRGGRRRDHLPRHHRLERRARDMIDVVIERVAEQVFIPLTVGGGVRTRRGRARRCSTPAPTRSSINTAAVDDPAARGRVARGASAARRSWWPSTRSAPARRGWEVYTHGGRTAHGHRRRRLGREDGRAGRRRDPAHQHGPRRHEDGLRPRADARRRRRACPSRSSPRGGVGTLEHLAQGVDDRRRRRGARGLDLPLRRVLRGRGQALPWPPAASR